jgi:hypothetical protein
MVKHSSAAASAGRPNKRKAAAKSPMPSQSQGMDSDSDSEPDFDPALLLMQIHAKKNLCSPLTLMLDDARSGVLLKQFHINSEKQNMVHSDNRQTSLCYLPPLGGVTLNNCVEPSLNPAAIRSLCPS